MRSTASSARSSIQAEDVDAAIETTVLVTGTVFVIALATTLARCVVTRPVATLRHPDALRQYWGRRCRMASRSGGMSPRGPTTSHRLAGKVGMVFGGGTPNGSVSVGQAAAVAYAAAGAAVVIVDARLDNARRTAALIADAMIVEADVTDDAAVAHAIAAAIERHGRLDVLHNNVGAPMAGRFADLTPADWSRGMALNCVGAALTMRHALPHLIRTRGAIVNVSSIAAIRHTGMNYAIYNASKAALDQLTVAVALEYAAYGVRANAILPGLLDTDMGRSLADPGDVDARSRRSPTGTQGDVWDVANAAIFLASDEARYINGHLLVVDGGLSRRC